MHRCTSARRFSCSFCRTRAGRRGEQQSKVRRALPAASAPIAAGQGQAGLSSRVQCMCSWGSLVALHMVCRVYAHVRGAPQLQLLRGHSVNDKSGKKEAPGGTAPDRKAARLVRILARHFKCPLLQGRPRTTCRSLSMPTCLYGSLGMLSDIWSKAVSAWAASWQA